MIDADATLDKTKTKTNTKISLLFIPIFLQICGKTHYR